MSLYGALTLGGVLLLVDLIEALRQYWVFFTDPDWAMKTWFADFKIIWGAALAWMHGLNPYDEHVMLDFLVSRQLIKPDQFNFFLYPPFSLYIIGPLGWFTFAQAVYLEIGLGLLVTAGTIYALARYTSNWQFAVLAGLYFVAGPWHSTNQMQGQTLNWLALALLLVFLTKKGRSALPVQIFLAIAFGALVAAKPSFLLPLGGVALLVEGPIFCILACGFAAVATVYAALTQAALSIGFKTLAASMPNLYLPWHGQMEKFVVYTNQSLNGITACFDKGIIMKLPSSVAGITGIALRLVLYGVLGGIALILGCMMLGQVLRGFKIKANLGRAEAAFAAWSLPAQASFVLIAVFLFQPISWVAYTMFMVPALLLWIGKGPVPTPVLWILAALLVRLNYVSYDTVKELAAKGGAGSFVSLAAIELYWSITGLSLLVFWGWMCTILLRKTGPEVANL